MSSDTVELPQSENLPSQAALDYQRVEKALRFLHANFLTHPSLGELAAHVHLSEFHFERLFQRWAGTSPKRFLQFLTVEHARSLLQQSATILQTTCDSGLSSPSRLHDLFITCEALTPGEYKTSGHGVTIRYGLNPTPFGNCLLALTDRGICALRFIDNPIDTGKEDLLAQWPQAKFIHAPQETADLCQTIFTRQPGRPAPCPLHVRGTNFQLKVWQALLSIPAGNLVSYAAIAKAIGCPGSNRAVGAAVGKNSIAFLIPCHRVIHSLGTLGNYRWGSVRKQAIIGWESSLPQKDS